MSGFKNTNKVKTTTKPRKAAKILNAKAIHKAKITTKSKTMAKAPNVRATTNLRIKKASPSTGDYNNHTPDSLRSNTTSHNNNNKPTFQRSGQSP